MCMQTPQWHPGVCQLPGSLRPPTCSSAFQPLDLSSLLCKLWEATPAPGLGDSSSLQLLWSPFGEQSQSAEQNLPGFSVQQRHPVQPPQHTGQDYTAEIQDEGLREAKRHLAERICKVGLGQESLTLTLLSLSRSLGTTPELDNSTWGGDISP